MENKFKIGQKVMVVKPAREEDRFKVGTVDHMYTDDSGHWVVIITAEAREFYIEAMLEPLPEMLQSKTLEEAERVVKAICKTADAIKAIGKACKDHAEEMARASEAFKQEADKDKEIAELKEQLTNKRQRRNEDIALELVKAWVGQEGQPVTFGKVMGAYQTALKELSEAEAQN